MSIAARMAQPRPWTACLPDSSDLCSVNEVVARFPSGASNHSCTTYMRSAAQCRHMVLSSTLRHTKGTVRVLYLLPLFLFCCSKGMSNASMKILSSFSYPHVVPYLYDFVSILEHRRRYKLFLSKV